MTESFLIDADILKGELCIKQAKLVRAGKYKESRGLDLAINEIDRMLLKKDHAEAQMFLEMVEPEMAGVEP